MMIVRKVLRRGSRTVTSTEPGHFPWHDPLSQPRDEVFLEFNATFAEPASLDPKSPASSVVAMKRKFNV